MGFLRTAKYCIGTFLFLRVFAFAETPSQIIKKYAELHVRSLNEIDLQTAMGKITESEIINDQLIEPLLNIVRNKNILIANRRRAVYLIGQKKLAPALSGLVDLQNGALEVADRFDPDEFAALKNNLALAIFQIDQNKGGGALVEFMYTHQNEIRSDRYLYFDFMKLVPASDQGVEFLMSEAKLFSTQGVNPINRSNMIEGLIIAAQNQKPERAFEILEILYNSIDQVQISAFQLREKLLNALLSQLQRRMVACADDVKRILSKQ